jgi:hypothetical protein
MLPVVLYGYETCSLTLREERRLKMVEIGVLRRIFRPEGDEVTGRLRKLHSEELHNLYFTSSKIRMIKSRRMRLAGHIGYWWETQKEGITVHCNLLDSFVLIKIVLR